MKDLELKFARIVSKVEMKHHLSLLKVALTFTTVGHLTFVATKRQRGLLVNVCLGIRLFLRWGNCCSWGEVRWNWGQWCWEKKLASWRVSGWGAATMFMWREKPEKLDHEGCVLLACFASNIKQFSHELESTCCWIQSIIDCLWNYISRPNISVALCCLWK